MLLLLLNLISVVQHLFSRAICDFHQDDAIVKSALYYGTQCKELVIILSRVTEKYSYIANPFLIITSQIHSTLYRHNLAGANV
jgi:hypothetical protein